MKRIGILLLTVCLATALSFAQASKKSDQKASSTKGAAKSDTAKTAKTEKPASGLDKGETASGKIDVNSASQADLEKLNGIGPVTAKKIVDGRPYKTKRDLLTKKIVSQGEYDKIKDNIIAHQEASAEKPSTKSDQKATTTKKK